MTWRKEHGLNYRVGKVTKPSRALKPDGEIVWQRCDTGVSRGKSHQALASIETLL